MEEDHKVNAAFYSINGATGEMKPLGAIAELPRLSNGGIEKDDYIDFAKLGEGATCEITITPKTITKKRFVKLLMGMNYQKNEANKMHQEYMKLNKYRTEIGMIFFEIFYKSKDRVELKIIMERERGSEV